VKEVGVKGLIKLIVLLAIVFFISSLFKGGDYVRQISNKTGIGLHSVADVADSLRIERFMAEKKQEHMEQEKKRLN
jgi:hypothetical protein